MKKFLCFLSLCVMLMSCNSDLGDFEKVKFQGKDISGIWVITGKIGEENKWGGYVGEFFAFDGDKYFEGWSYNDNGLEFKNGYIYAPREAVELKYFGKFTITSKGDLYVDGEYYDYRMYWRGDKLIMESTYEWSYDNSCWILERVKGFKN